MRRLIAAFLFCLSLGAHAGQINVTTNGVVADCVTDQTNTVNALLAANPNNTAFYFPAGCYVLAGMGQTGVPALHDVDIIGDGSNSTIFKAPAGTAKNAILAIPANSSGVSVRGVKFDANNAPAVLFSIYTVSSFDIDIHENKFINWSYIAVAVDSVNQYRIYGNRIIRATTGGIGQTQTNTIVVSSSVSASSNGIISNNYETGAGMNIASANTVVNGNLVISYAYGAGLVTSPHGHGGLFLASGNMLMGGVGKDSDGTFPAGAELNTDYTAFIGNVAAVNAGEGVSSVGYASHIAANYATMNGNGSDGLGSGVGMTDIQRSGIVLATLPGQTGALNSSVLANRAFDGGPGRQKYGYYEMLYNGQLSGVKVLGNNLGNNIVGKTSIGSTSTVYDGN